MRFIDCHVHCFPDSIAEKAVASLAGAYDLKPAFDGTIAGLIPQMDAAGISASFLQCVATKPSQVQSINDWVAGVQNERLIPLGAMHPDFPEPQQEIQRMTEMGMRGIKFHPNWQNFRPDDERMMPVYEAMQGRLIAYFHAGEEIEDWPEILATPEALARVRSAFPGLTMVCAHMGGFRMWDDVRRYLLYEDVFFDMSYCFPADMPDELMVEFIRIHGAERVVFGSDSPCGDPVAQMKRLLSLRIGDEEKELIAWRNAARLVAIA